MHALPQPGDYSATGLPDDYTLFSAWMFLNMNSDAQPEIYRQGRSLALARSLMEAGETSPVLLGGALLSLMPVELNGQIARRVSPAIAATVDDFARQTMTHFAYIDHAGADAQKISLAMLGNTILHLMKTGDTTLRHLQAATSAGEGAEPSASLLADPRNFMLIAAKTQATLGDCRLHEAFAKSTSAYRHYRHDYLFTLVTMERLPQRLRAAAAALLEPVAPLPAFAQAGLPDTPAMQGVYRQLANDPRVPPAEFAAALDIAATLAACPDVAAATVTAAMIARALPQLNTQDLHFLQRLGGDDCVALLAEAPAISSARVPLRQMAAAQAISMLKKTAFRAARMQAQLATRQQDVAPAQLRHVIDSFVSPASDSLNAVITTVLPQAHRLESPALTALLRRHVGQATASLDDLVELTARLDTTGAAAPAHNGRKNGPAL